MFGDNEEGFSCLQEIEVGRLKSERCEEGKMKVEGSNRMARGWRVEGCLRFNLREVGENEDEDRSLSMASM